MRTEALRAVRLLGYRALLFGKKSPTFRKNTLPPYSLETQVNFYQIILRHVLVLYTRSRGAGTTDWSSGIWVGVAGWKRELLEL
jgi:hypothetical protein